MAVVTLPSSAAVALPELPPACCLRQYIAAVLLLMCEL
jgi:hypothetical protein